ncbi:MAG: NAD(P)H-hydrate dehydratase [Planctomycetota bacterium]|nr:NAD(P)H-hydrate dehydratase [Planctomycetota bacterium]
MTWTPPAPPELPLDAHKGTAGRVLLACGSAWMPGAAILAARAAQRAGAGLVRVGCRDPELVAIVAGAAPEAVFEMGVAVAIDSGDHHAALVGPGLGLDAVARGIVECALARADVPLVLDADALTILAREPRLAERRRGALVLTPHPGEAARLLGHEAAPDPAGRLAAARTIASRFGAVVCLKGRATVVTDGERDYVNDTGNPGMATAGAGDVLAGVLVAYLGATVTLPSPGWTAFEAAARAVWIHGRAGDLAAAELGARALIASDLVEFLPRAQRG